MHPKRKSQHPLLSILKPEGLGRLRGGHPWIRKKEVADASAFPRDVSLLHMGEHWFLWDPDSFLCLRRVGLSKRNWLYENDRGGPLSIADIDIMLPWIKEHLVSLWRYKKQIVLGEKCFRWIFSDADLLPGLTIDCYDKKAVIEIGHPFWLKNEELITKALGHADVGVNLEFIKSKSRIEDGGGDWIEWNGFHWWMSPGSSQKTGSYLDQRENHLKAAKWARCRGHQTAWDLCSFEGGFSLHLAQVGLNTVAVDQSQRALEVLEKNVHQNALGSKIVTRKEDVFIYLREAFDTKKEVDMIVLDPPSIVKSFSEIDGALRGLKELCLRSLHTLKSGGTFVLCTCSYHLTSERVEKVLREAAHDARREIRLLEMGSQSADHGPLVSCPETHYLRSYFLSVF